MKISLSKTVLAVSLSMSVAALSSPVFASPDQASPDSRYIVEQGDTFWKISKQLNIPLDDILAANADVDPANLQHGSEITIPEQQLSEVASIKMQLSEVATITASSGETLHYKQVIEAKSTAYTDDPNENIWGDLDYMGNKLQLGTIAVDPDVIPMGATVYITGYDSPLLPEGGMIARATDQGGAIKGNRIDIFIPGSPQTVKMFGIQDVTIYVLSE